MHEPNAIAMAVGSTSRRCEARPKRCRFVEVDAETFEPALHRALADLTPAERLLGKVSEDGEIIWGGYPRAKFRRI